MRSDLDPYFSCSHEAGFVCRILVTTILSSLSSITIFWTLSLHCNQNSWNSMVMIMSMGWNWISELRLPAGLLFIPRLCMSMENHGGKISVGENSWFVHQKFLTILPAESSSSKAIETGEGNEFVFMTYLFHTSKGSSACRKVLHGADGFTFHQKESVLRNFDRPRPGLNSLPLGSMASTLIITPPITTFEVI
jgi:hypothetical protein